MAGSRFNYYFLFIFYSLRYDFIKVTLNWLSLDRKTGWLGEGGLEESLSWTIHLAGRAQTLKSNSLNARKHKATQRVVKYLGVRGLIILFWSICALWTEGHVIYNVMNYSR